MVVADSILPGRPRPCVSHLHHPRRSREGALLLGRGSVETVGDDQHLVTILLDHHPPTSRRPPPLIALAVDIGRRHAAELGPLFHALAHGCQAAKPRQHRREGRGILLLALLEDTRVEHDRRGGGRALGRAAGLGDAARRGDAAHAVEQGQLRAHRGHLARQLQLHLLQLADHVAHVAKRGAHLVHAGVRARAVEAGVVRLEL
eukprot:400948-Prymnesium_polylepis.2